MEARLERPKGAVVTAGVSIIFLVAALIWGLAQARDAAHAGSVAHAALCIQHKGYVQQRAQTERLLARQHGPVIHYGGLAFTRAVLVRSAQQQTLQIRALAILHCPEGS